MSSALASTPLCDDKLYEFMRRVDLLSLRGDEYDDIGVSNSHCFKWMVERLQPP